MDLELKNSDAMSKRFRKQAADRKRRMVINKLIRQLKSIVLRSVGKNNINLVLIIIFITLRPLLSSGVSCQSWQLSRNFELDSLYNHKYGEHEDEHYLGVVNERSLGPKHQNFFVDEAEFKDLTKPQILEITHKYIEYLQYSTDTSIRSNPDGYNKRKKAFENVMLFIEGLKRGKDTATDKMTSSSLVQSIHVHQLPVRYNITDLPAFNIPDIKYQLNATHLVNNQCLQYGYRVPHFCGAPPESIQFSHDQVPPLPRNDVPNLWRPWTIG